MAQGDVVTTIVGNLTDAPELRFTPQGAAVAKFRLASTPRFLDKASNEWRDGDPLFLDCVVWRQMAEQVAESLDRGHRVIATGRLKQESWEDKNGGGKRSKLILEVDDVGPSLRYATAAVKKMERSSGGGQQPTQGGSDDPWATAAPAGSRQPADLPPPF